MEAILTVVTKVLVMLIMIAVGYLSRKKGCSPTGAPPRSLALLI